MGEQNTLICKDQCPSTIIKQKPYRDYLKWNKKPNSNGTSYFYTIIRCNHYPYKAQYKKRNNMTL